MMHLPFSLKISYIHNWTSYESRVAISAESQSQQTIFQKIAQGKLCYSSLQLDAIIPIWLENIQLNFSTLAGTKIGYASIIPSQLQASKQRYYPLSPNNQYVIEVEWNRHQERLDESQLSFRSNSQLNLRRNRFDIDKQSLKQKYKNTEAQLIRSISQYYRSVDKMASLGKELNNIQRQIKSRSQSKVKLMSLKQAISESKLKFTDLVYPYTKAKKNPRITPSSSSSSPRIFGKFATATTLPDDDYGMFTSRHKYKNGKQATK